ncbi:unnamed protein product [Prorocentrum cordatum]|uniref:Uncharacterized protein n=1 Tax=Prorocentrum cordatum TaxID=2364126 RepID=A0ABN9PF07_9DINO|nr:unnamed protein product [Polarella glacialis]
MAGEPPKKSKRAKGDEGVDTAQMNDFISGLIYGRILNGMCITMIFGNFYYAWMAIRMMRVDGRSDHMCMPYGVNTAAAFAFVYNIMAVAARDAKEAGMEWEEGINYAWKVTTVANLAAGFIAALVGFAGPAIMKVAPKPALLIALAGVGLTHLGIAQLMKVFAAGHLGFVPLATAVLGYFVGVKFYPIPNAVMIMLAGAFMGWVFSSGWPEDKVDKDGGTWESVKNAASIFRFYTPRLLDTQAFFEIPEVALENISVILPVAFVGAINTLVSVYNAHEAGDPYSVKETLVVDGCTTMVSALFGSPFGTCVFCSHKPLKRAGGTIYSILFFLQLRAVLLHVRYRAVLDGGRARPSVCHRADRAVHWARDQPGHVRQHRESAPPCSYHRTHMPAIADWANSQMPPGAGSPSLMALGYGSLLSAIILTAMVVFAINANFMQCSIWALVGAFLSTFGIVHQPRADLTFQNFTGTKGAFGVSQAAFMIGYLSLAAVFAVLGTSQRMGVSRVPKKKFDANEKETQEEIAMDMVRVNTQNEIWNALNDANPTMARDKSETIHESFEDGEGGSSSDDASSSD